MALIVIVNRNRQDFFGVILTYDVLIKVVVDLVRLGDFQGRQEFFLFGGGCRRRRFRCSVFAALVEHVLTKL